MPRKNKKFFFFIKRILISIITGKTILSTEPAPFLYDSVGFLTKRQHFAAYTKDLLTFCVFLTLIIYVCFVNSEQKSITLPLLSSKVITYRIGIHLENSLSQVSFILIWKVNFRKLTSHIFFKFCLIFDSIFCLMSC